MHKKYVRHLINLKWFVVIWVVRAEIRYPDLPILIAISIESLNRSEVPLQGTCCVDLFGNTDERNYYSINNVFI